LAIRRKLAASNPDIYLPDVAHVLWGIGRACIWQFNREHAQAALAEALDIYSEFAERGPAQYGPFLREVKKDLARVAR
jgi:hypothetical protein